MGSEGDWTSHTQKKGRGARHWIRRDWAGQGSTKTAENPMETCMSDTCEITGQFPNCQPLGNAPGLHTAGQHGHKTKSNAMRPEWPTSARTLLDRVPSCSLLTEHLGDDVDTSGSHHPSTEEQVDQRILSRRNENRHHGKSLHRNHPIVKRAYVSRITPAGSTGERRAA